MPATRAGRDDGPGSARLHVLGLVGRGHVTQPRPADDLKGDGGGLGAAVMGVVEHRRDVPAALFPESLVGVRIDTFAARGGGWRAGHAAAKRTLPSWTADGQA